MILLSPLSVRDLVGDVEWETLLFFMGLFILVGALVHVGALDAVASGLVDLTGAELVPTLLVVLVGSAVISAIVDNIPYVTAMSPVVASLIETNPELGHNGALWWALALGADLGGNATLVGASANVVVAGVAARNGLRLTFAGWLRYGHPDRRRLAGVLRPVRAAALHLTCAERAVDRLEHVVGPLPDPEAVTRGDVVAQLDRVDDRVDVRADRGSGPPATPRA